MDKPEITLKQLACLLAVEETRHFRRAAERRGLAQPSLTAQIHNLEGAVGARLVERGRSGVALTPLGREVARRAARVLSEAQGILDLKDGGEGGMVGVIRLGASPTIGPYLMPYVVAALHRRYKDLRLYIRESAPRDLEFDLGAGVHDVVVTQLPMSSRDNVAAMLYDEPLYLALARDHPLAAIETLSPNMLEGIDVLTLGPHYRLYDQVNALCATFGARLLSDYEGTSLDALRQMVGMGMGATFLPATYAQSEIRARSEVTIKTIKGRRIMRQVGLAWRKSAGRAEHYRAIAQVIREVAGRTFKDVAVESGPLTENDR